MLRAGWHRACESWKGRLWLAHVVPMSFPDLKRALAYAVPPAMVAGGLAMLDGMKFEPEHVKVRRVDVSAGRWERQLAGVKIVQISDLHAGGRAWRPDTIARAIEICNDEEPDVIAVTGDFLGGRGHTKRVLEILSRLRCDVPKLAVLGNHDYVYGAVPLGALLEGLRSLGVSVLRNEARHLRMRNGCVWFVGVEDGYGGRDDLEKATSTLNRDGCPRVLLTHYPEVAEAARPGEFQLALAGHSHAGQIRVPLLDRFVTRRHARTRYGYGMYEVSGNPLYVSSGLGMSALPVRFRNLPEVAVHRFAT